MVTKGHGQVSVRPKREVYVESEKYTVERRTDEKRVFLHVVCFIKQNGQS